MDGQQKERAVSSVVPVDSGFGGQTSVAAGQSWIDGESSSA